jgi:hypothetical protein
MTISCKISVSEPEGKNKYFEDLGIDYIYIKVCEEFSTLSPPFFLLIPFNISMKVKKSQYVKKVKSLCLTKYPAMKTYHILN